MTLQDPGTRRRVAVALGLFHWRTGGMGAGHKSTPTGRIIERFTYLERVSHWAVAISFVILAVSGIAPWGTAMPWMVGCHLLVGLIEGALTASALHALRGSPLGLGLGGNPAVITDART